MGSENSTAFIKERNKQTKYHDKSKFKAYVNGKLNLTSPLTCRFRKPFTLQTVYSKISLNLVVMVGWLYWSLTPL